MIYACSCCFADHVWLVHDYASKYLQLLMPAIVACGWLAGLKTVSQAWQNVGHSQMSFLSAILGEHILIRFIEFGVCFY